MFHDYGNDEPTGIDRRNFLKTTAAATIAGAATGIGAGTAYAVSEKYAPPPNPALPPSDMKLDLRRTALVVTDPLIDFLSPKGVAWKVVQESVEELNTVENVALLHGTATNRPALGRRRQCSRIGSSDSLSAPSWVAQTGGGVCVFMDRGLLPKYLASSMLLVGRGRPGSRPARVRPRGGTDREGLYRDYALGAGRL